ALLKTLEEPPAHVIFILATTEAHKILATIMSRCQRFDFRRLPQADVVSKLIRICETEGINIEPEAIRLVAKSATGSLRDAENLLEQLTTYYGPEISLHQVQETLGITGDWRTKELARHIINNDVAAGVATINSVNTDGLNLRQFNRELVEYLRGLLLIKTGAEEAVDLTAEDTAELKELASRASLPQVLKAVKVFGQLEPDLEIHSTLPLELAIVDCSLTSLPEQESPIQQPKYEAPQPQKEASTAPITQAEEPQPAPESTPTEAPQSVSYNNSPQTSDEEIARLRQDWKRLIAEVPPEIRKTPALAILRSAGIMPVSIDNGTVILSSRYPYLKEKLEDPENQRVVEKVISTFLGHPCRVRCVSEDNHLVKEALRLGGQIITAEEE
ncbi:MAG: DNA polymerase III subunit gamma/tau, partial [Dehalococcoidales bacterium]